jgi:hypothetical protein
MQDYDPSNPNSGHGHVYPRPDKARARCGGPALCGKCAADAARKEREERPPVSADWPPVRPGAPITEPCIAVPEGFAGSDAEAVALAVAGAVQAIALERDSWRSHARTTYDNLARVVETYPQTGFAASESALEAARDWLAYLGEALGIEPKPEV